MKEQNIFQVPNNSFKKVKVKIEEKVEKQLRLKKKVEKLR